MSLCPINETFTFTLAGGHPGGGESLDASVFRYTSTGLVEHEVEDFDPLVDSVFTFIPSQDGVYRFFLTGVIGGELLLTNFIVDADAKRSTASIVKMDVNNMQCGRCSDSNYQLYKALLSFSQESFECGEYLSSEKALTLIQEVAKGNCSPDLCDNG